MIRSILVTSLAPMENHAANRGEKLLGNASSVKRRPDGRVYISGQMQRHVLFSAIERLNEVDPNRGDTFVANGDGPTTNINTDLRSDLGGFLDTNKGDYSGRRTAPLTATPAVALRESSVGTDLLVRLKMDQNENSKKQAIALNEFSEKDLMVMNFHLDIGAVGVTKLFDYEDERHVKTYYKRHISQAEHARRVRLFLDATRSMTDFANQARNAVSGEPTKVLIVLDPKMSRKAVRYFLEDTSEILRKNILAELESRGARYFLGDDTSTSENVHTVAQAYDAAFEALEEAELYWPGNE